MKKSILLSILLLLGLMLLTVSSSINGVKASTIFSDNFQSGNLNNWTKNSGTLSISNQVTNNGEPYSVQSNLAGPKSLDSPLNLYQHAITPQTTLDVREYVYINSTAAAYPTTNGDYYQVGGFGTSAGGQEGDGELIVTNVGGQNYWGLYVRQSTGSVNPQGFDRWISQDNQTSDAIPVASTPGWTCIELQQRTSTSTTYPWNGVDTLWINGQMLFNQTSVANWDRTPAYVVIGGCGTITSSSDAWTYYIADVVVGNSYIGPNQNTLTTSANYGTVTNNPTGTSYAEGQQVQITAVPPTATAGEQYLFVGWTGSGVGSYTGTNNPATVTMNSAITETATWQHQYELTIISPQGTSTVNETWYNSGVQTTANISPQIVGNSENSSVPVGTRYVFAGWSGDASGTGLTSNFITMNGPETAVALWTTQYYLTTNTAHGTVTGAGWYDAGSTPTVTLNSATSPGSAGVQYAFTNWGSDASGSTLTSNAIPMDGPKTATTFWNTQYNLTITQSGVGSDYTGTLVTVDGNNYTANGYSAWVNANTAYTFSYTPLAIVSNTTAQYLITGVTGNSSATSGTVTAPTTITASYNAQYYLTVTSQYDSPAPTSGWFDNGTSVNAYVSSPSSGYSCSGWSGTGSVPASGSTSVVKFTITSPSTLTWKWVSESSSTPTPTPSPTPKASSTPTPTPKVTATPTPTSSSTPKPTSTPVQNNQGSNVNNYIYGVIVAIVLVVVVASVLFLRMRKKPQKIQTTPPKTVPEKTK